MHRSRLAGFIIDCDSDDLDAATRFWSQALGYPLRPGDEEADGKYRELDTRERDLYLEVQQVAPPSRIHLDIEADDIEAEVARLEALGARRVGYVRTWCVMEAPTGQRFCVVRAQTGNFDATANEWGGE